MNKKDPLFLPRGTGIKNKFSGFWSQGLRFRVSSENRGIPEGWLALAKETLLNFVDAVAAGGKAAAAPQDLRLNSVQVWVLNIP